ncbi:MAG TPA: LuxR C-terminal-related transcriptional regulator, partial [Anaerolineae bacterium]
HYMDRLLAAFSGEAPARPTEAPLANRQTKIESLAEPLTGREIEVLHLVAEGLTYQEIAQRLVVSLNTVRFHVKGIYGKLGVGKRMAAVEKARVLGLL